MKQFFNLHAHSSFSTLDSCIKIDELVKHAKANNISAIALTEHGTLSGTYEQWDECNKAGVKPILGIEAYYVDDVNVEEGIMAGSYSHIVLLCKNEKGWRNLKKLQSLAWNDGFLKKPRMDYNMIEKYHDGLICSTACTHGLVGAIINKNKYYELKTDSERDSAIVNRIKKFKKLFGKDFYFEIMLNELDEQKELNIYLLSVAKLYGVEFIVTNDCHYINIEDNELHDIVKCIQWKKTLEDEGNGTYETRVLNYANYDEMIGLWKKYHKGYIPSDVLTKAIDNCTKIANSVEKFKIRTDDSALPKFSDDAVSTLKQLCEDGIQTIFGSKFNTEYRKRLDYELGVINKLGMADYFLIVRDLIQYAITEDIPYNARGSVAGSLVAYIIGITWIDPIRFNTTFERFLTEDRLSLPDIDMDFGKSCRQKLINYLRNKYGSESVAHIVNFSIYKPKQAIKDVARVFRIPFGLSNKITKQIPDNTENWEDIPDVEDINKFFEDNPDVKDNAQKILNIIRHRGVHASGIVVTPGKTIKWTPIAWSTQGEDDVREKVIEYDMYAVEDLNMLKLDILGLNTLDIIKHAIGLIGNKDIDTFPKLCRKMLNSLDDKKVYQEIRTGNLVGTFQMGTSDGMRQLITDMKPTKIEDIVASIALYRTAVLTIGAHTRYINRRFGRERINYLHPLMEESLKDTYGIMLYQESISSLAVVLAGFTKSESDNFRKGIKRKDSDVFKKWEEKFIKGCKDKNKIDKELAEKIWGEMVVWSGYGFNKSHSASYAIIALTTMWLKVYYPSEYMTALLSFNSSEDDKMSVYIKEVKRMGVKLVKPKINNSTSKFRLINGKILYPFTVIKNVGDKAIKDIIGARKKGGKFTSFEDFYNRVTKRVVNIRVIKNLIFANCFGEFGKVDNIYNQFVELYGDKTIHALYCVKCKSKYPVSLTKKGVSESGAVCPECGDTETVTEYELIKDKKFNISYCWKIIYGFSVENPLQPYLGDFINYNVVKMADIDNLSDGDKINIGGFVNRIKKHIDRNQNEMAFISMSDGEADYDIVIFASIWERISNMVKKGGVYIFNVKIDSGKFLLNGNAQSVIKLASKGASSVS